MSKKTKNKIQTIVLSALIPIASIAISVVALTNHF